MKNKNNKYLRKIKDLEVVFLRIEQKLKYKK